MLTSLSRHWQLIQTTKSITIFNKFARLKKQPKQQHSQTRHAISPVSKSRLIGQVVAKIKNEDKQGASVLLDTEFYNNINNKVGISEIIKWKNSVDYYYRDYEALLMNIQNQQILAGKNSETELNGIRKLLVYLLSNHSNLPKTQKTQQDNSITQLYIKSLVQLIKGQKNEQSIKVLLQILNTPIGKLINVNMPQQQNKRRQQEHRLLSMSSSLNFIEQIFINLIIFHMISDTDNTNRQLQKRTALNLYKKIKSKHKLQVSDFILDDYENFLNVWVSAKYDTPMQWTDLSEQQMVPYYKVIYLLAQNYYINKNMSRCKDVLSYLPASYPPRQLLELSQLYDTNNFLEMRKKFEEISQQKWKDPKYYKSPSHDIIYHNMLKIMQKMQEKLSKTKQQHKDLAEQLTQVITIYRYENNIEDIESASLPFYYFIIPFEMFFVHNSFQELFY